jgi:homoserine kinase type II
MGTWDRLEYGLPTLGRIHELLKRMDAGSVVREPYFANHIEAEVALAGTHRGLARLRAMELKPNESETMDRYEELAALVHEAEQPYIPDLRRQVVHGDYWHNNVLMRDGDIALVLDLDFMGERPRTDDLALTLYFANASIPGNPLGEDRIEHLRRLVNAYDSGLTDHLSAEERAALPIAIARQPLFDIGRWSVDEPDTERALETAMWRVHEVRWTLALMHNLSRWQEAFAA